MTDSYFNCVECGAQIHEQDRFLEDRDWCEACVAAEMERHGNEDVIGDDHGGVAEKRPAKYALLPKDYAKHGYSRSLRTVSGKASTSELSGIDAMLADLADGEPIEDLLEQYAPDPEPEPEPVVTAPDGTIVDPVDPATDQSATSPPAVAASNAPPPITPPPNYTPPTTIHELMELDIPGLVQALTDGSADTVVAATKTGPLVAAVASLASTAISAAMAARAGRLDPIVIDTLDQIGDKFTDEITRRIDGVTP